MKNDYLKLIRVNNLLFIAIILGLMANMVVKPILMHHQIVLEVFPWWELLLLVLATALIAAGGNVINDYFDVKIDAINKPDDLIVTRSVSKQQAMRLFMILTGVGVACGLAVGFILKSTTLMTLFVVVPGILWFYSASYKRQFLVGNLIVAILSGLTPLVIAFAAEASLKTSYGENLLGQMLINEIYVYVGGFGLFAFLCTLCREIIKDIEDQEGDREMECHTIVVKYGETVAKISATVLLLCTMALMSYITFCCLPIAFSWAALASRFYIVMMIGCCCELALLWNAKLTSDYRHAQLLMKGLMFIGTMYAFCIPSML